MTQEIIKKCLTNTKKSVGSIVAKGYFIHGFDAEDLVQHCFAELYRKSYYQNYRKDGGASLGWYISIAVKRELNDLSQKQHSVRTLSLDVPIQSGDGISEDTYKDSVEDKTQTEVLNNRLTEITLEEVSKWLSGEPLSDYYKYSFRSLFNLFVMRDYRVVDVANHYNISPSMASHLKRDLIMEVNFSVPKTLFNSKDLLST